MCTFGFLVLSIRCEGDLWEISGSLRANKVWRSPGSDFSADCELASPQELCLCLPEFASLFAISLTFKHTRISYGGNALGGRWWFV